MGVDHSRTVHLRFTAVPWTAGLGRYYERFADHAVSVARRVVYLVTGDDAATTR